MCYSRSWNASEDRKREEAKTREAAHQKRAGVIDNLLADAKENAETAKRQQAPVKDAAPAK
jgi:hypothetical protein